MVIKRAAVLALEVMIHMKVDVIDPCKNSILRKCDKLYLYHRQNEYLCKTSNLNKTSI
jgi:hypothetical protein